MIAYHNSAVLQFDSLSTGNAAALVSVTVRLNSSQALAVLFDLDESQIANPVTTDPKGNYAFKAVDGIYDIIINEGNPEEVKLEKINLFEGISSQDINVINFKELSSAVSDTSVKINSAANIKERTTGNGGGAMWDYVLASSVVVNGFDIVACTGVPTLALALRKPNANPSAWGLLDDGTSDNSLALVNLLESSQVDISVDSIFTISTQVAATLIKDKVITGSGGFKWAGAAAKVHMVSIDLAGFDLEFSLTMDGSNTISSGLKVFNNTPQSGLLPTVCCSNGEYKNFNKSGDSTGDNEGLRIQGSIESVDVSRNRITNIGREAGTGVLGSTGTNGVLVVHSASTFYPKKVVHKNNVYSGLYSNELTGANDVDVDNFALLIPDPLNFPNDDATFNEYPDVDVESCGNTYIDPIGRCAKFQCVPNVHHETVYRNGSRSTTGYVFTPEFGLQWGVGSVSDISYNYSAVAGVSPLANDVVPVSFFNGTDYNVKKTGIVFKDSVINTDIPASLVNRILYLADLSVGAPVQSVDTKSVLISNIVMNSGKVDHLISVNHINGKVPIKLTDIYVEECSFEIVGASANGAGLTFDIDNIGHNGTDVNFYGNIGGGVRNFNGAMLGSNFKGIKGQFRKSLGSVDSLPVTNGALGNNNIGGALSVQSDEITDDATKIFDVRGYTKGMHSFIVTNTFSNVSALFSSAGASGGITALTTIGTSTYYALGAGINPDVDGKINMWIDANGQLNLKNRLGSIRVFTILFLG